VPRIRLERGPVVCEQGVLATTAWMRSKGLLGRSGMAETIGMNEAALGIPLWGSNRRMIANG
jgi:hypothetical protein